MRIGLYPGTFDPVTNGHTDIIKRALKLVDRVVIGVAQNDDKGAVVHHGPNGSRCSRPRWRTWAAISWSSPSRPC